MKLIHKVADCDFCTIPTPAVCDAPTMIGPWANMCEWHEERLATPAAEKVGYRLTRDEVPEPTDDDIRTGIAAAIAAGDFDAAEEILGDRDFAEFL